MSTVLSSRIIRIKLCCVLLCILICFLLAFSKTDEVGALVFDMGSYSVRAGYAGEDCPKVCTVRQAYILVLKLKGIDSDGVVRFLG